MYLLHDVLILVSFHNMTGKSMNSLDKLSWSSLVHPLTFCAFRIKKK